MLRTAELIVGGIKLKPPLWYSEQEIRENFFKDGYPNKTDMPKFLAEQLQLAFEKGWEKKESSTGVRTCVVCCDGNDPASGEGVKDV